MLKPIQQILDAVAQRLIATVSGLIATTVEAITAAQQAEQYGRLEELARQFEADGKTEIAAVLRSRAQQLLAECQSRPTTTDALSALNEFGLTASGRAASRQPNVAEPTTSSRAGAKGRRRFSTITEDTASQLDRPTTDPQSSEPTGV